eukprot:12405945-Karenia_brevis.AAC.1
MVEQFVERYKCEGACEQDFIMSLSDNRLALVEESLKSEYDKEYPAGLSSALPASNVDTFGKDNVMRVATSLFVANASLRTTPPSNSARRPWPWNTPDR